MRKLEDIARIVETDVLIIGGGFAGTWAALRARDFSNKVILVDKARVASSGCSTFASGVQLCPLPEDNLDLWKKEIVERSEYFADQEFVEIFLHNQMERVHDYLNGKAPIERDEKGNVARIVGRGHINTRLFQFHGPKLMAWLRDAIIKKDVMIMERIMVVDLLTSDGLLPTKGNVMGAIGFHIRTGEPHIFRAKSVVIASGPISGKKSHAADNCTGDGVALAFRAGAEITNMEFCVGGNITVWERKRSGAGGINMIQGHGAYFLNNKGERFMEKYDPLLMERSLPYKLCMAFCKEALEGRGPVLVDMRHFPFEVWEKFRRVIPRTMAAWDASGIDLTKHMVECSPSSDVRSPSGEGGIKIDNKGRTNIPGLFAAGAACRNPIQGIYALGGLATASANVLGYIAGENAASYSKNIPVPVINFNQAENIWEAAFSPLKRKEGPSPIDFFNRLAEIIAPAKFNLFKNERRIRTVLSSIAKINEDLSLMMSPDYHELVKANEFKNYLLCAEMVYRAALERKESRQYHYREEYPYRDDGEWLKLILLSRRDSTVVIRYEDIPVDNWPLKPGGKAKIAHPIQVFVDE